MSATLPLPTIGAPAPPIELTLENGSKWRLSDNLDSGPAVVIFHRHIY